MTDHDTWIMTNLLEQIRRDREAGTSGPWAKDKWSCLKSSNGEVVTVWGLGIAHSNRDEETEANARRMARTPAMEEALLAAEELMEGAAAIMAMVESGAIRVRPSDREEFMSGLELLNDGDDAFRAALEVGQ